MPKPAAPAFRQPAIVAGIDPAHRQHRDFRRQHRAQCAQYGGTCGLRGEQLQRVGAGGQQRECLGGGEAAGNSQQAPCLGGMHHIHSGVGRHDQASAGGGDLLHLCFGHHRAGADQQAIAKLLGEPGDAVQRIRRIERHFDDDYAANFQCGGDGRRFIRTHAAQDGDQWASFQPAGNGLPRNDCFALLAHHRHSRPYHRHFREGIDVTAITAVVPEETPSFPRYHPSFAVVPDRHSCGTPSFAWYPVICAVPRHLRVYPRHSRESGNPRPSRTHDGRRRRDMDSRFRGNDGAAFDAAAFDGAAFEDGERPSKMTESGLRRNDGKPLQPHAACSPIKARPRAAASPFSRSAMPPQASIARA